MTWDKLSVWLLIQICNAADILELVQYLPEEGVIENSILRLSIICLLHASQLQFCFHNTPLPEMDPETASPSTDEERVCGLSRELWEIILPFMLQDLPFLCLRFTLYFRFKVNSLHLIFYTIKSILFLLTQIFQALVLLCGQ
ncbi:unnamed protein product [Dibothriocephalus latus]|uniref:Timeless N-terminal domain-containing protein n=1 Tax=Dibothriocephalus latus TaxID=60516 RepID=A0A3P6STK4_DIBLA|nr:unnamed protein product [Dibothriocephalus latus]